MAAAMIDSCLDLAYHGWQQGQMAAAMIDSCLDLA
jgi:hypothetical protein